MDQKQQAKKAPTPERKLSRKQREHLFLGYDVKVDRRGRGIPVLNFTCVGTANSVRPATGNREKARAERRAARKAGKC